MVKLSSNIAIQTYFFLLNTHPIPGPRSTQARGLLNAIVFLTYVNIMRCNIYRVYRKYFYKLWDGFLTLNQLKMSI